MWLRVAKATGFVSLLSGAALTAGQSGSVRVDPVAGASLYMTHGCVGCHESPAGRSDPSVVDLSGDVGRFQSALLDYRAGARQHAVMNQVARGLNDDDIGHLAAYLSAKHN